MSGKKEFGGYVILQGNPVLHILLNIAGFLLLQVMQRPLVVSPISIFPFILSSKTVGV